MFPKVRAIEAVPMLHEEETVVVLRDPEDLNPDPMMVTPGAYLLMSMLDGSRGSSQIQSEILRQSGQLVPRETIEKFITSLDESFLLENERARRRRKELAREFASRTTRPPSHAGEAYPAEPDRLRRGLRDLFESSTTTDKAPINSGKRPRGLVVPHIDPRCGGPCMARGFASLDREALPSHYIVLGVAHYPTPHLFTLTEKDFETPLGTVQTDRGITRRIKEEYGPHLLEGEIAHKREHSIEFTSVFLKYLHGKEHEISITPILCGSLHEEFDRPAGHSPLQREDVRRFSEVLREVTADLGSTVCVIASVDLSHVGLKFGGSVAMDPAQAREIRAADLDMLKTIEQRDPEAFFEHFRRDRNARNVDAVTAVYTLLNILGPGESWMIDYDQFLEDSTGSLVSFASLALY